MEGLVNNININECIVYSNVYCTTFYNIQYKLYHQIKLSLIVKLYMCPVCGYRGITWLNLIAHTMNHSAVKPICLQTHKIMQTMMDGINDMSFVNYMNYMVKIINSGSYMFLYNYENTNCRTSVLYGCISYQWHCIQIMCTIFHINDILNMYVLCYWNRVCVKYRGALSNRCDSPNLPGTLYGYNLSVYMIVMLSHTGAIRLVFIVLSLCIQYILVVIPACDYYNIDMNYEQNVVVHPLLGVFRLVRGCASIGYNTFYHKNGY